MINVLQSFTDKIVLYVSSGSEQKHRLLLFVILLLGFSLRLHGLIVGEGYREFSIKDEVSAYHYALAFLAGEPHAWYLGQPAFMGGHAPGPMWTLFWALIYKLGLGTPDGAMFWMLTVNTFVIYLVYRLSRVLLGRDYALLTALLYATAAWPMFYSVSLWNPVPMALLGALLFISLWQCTQNENSRSIFLVCLISAIIPQFHMIGLFYYPAILLVLYLSPVKLNTKWFVLGILAGLCVYLPYLTGEMLNNWQNTKDMFGESVPESYGVAKILTTPIGMLSNQISRWAGYTFDAYREFGDSYFGSYIILLTINLVSMFISMVFVFSILRQGFTAMRGNWFAPKRVYAQYPASLFIGIFLILPPLLFLLTRHNYGSRYSIITFPILFMLPAFYLSNTGRAGVKSVFGFLLAIMICFNCYLYVVFNQHIGNRIEQADYYVPSFRNMEQTRQELHAITGAESTINIVADRYISDASEEVFTAGVALSGYINTTEKYLSPYLKPGNSITLYLARHDDELPTTASIIYRSNDMVVYRSTTDD